jgi:DNA-binding MarR family transcriptional regulator
MEISRNFTDETYTLLRLVKRNFYAKQIARELNMSQATIHRRLKSLVASNLLSVEVRSSCQLYKLTEKGETAIQNHEVSQPSYPTTIPQKGVHDLAIKLPIIQRPAVMPIGLWDRVNTDFKHSVQRHSYFKDIDGSVRETSKHICIQLRPRKLYNYQQINSLISGSVAIVAGELSRHGYVLDVMNQGVSMYHVTYGDQESRELIQKGVKVKVGLDRPRYKFFPNDTEQTAYVELCRTPDDNWESNDREWARLKALEPELIAQIQRDMVTLTAKTAELAENLTAHIPALKGLTKVTNRLDKILSQKKIGDFR